MTELLKRSRFPPPVDKAAVADDWRARGFSCDAFVDPPGRQWLEFVHRCNELVTVVEGRLDMHVGHQKFLMEPGDEAFIPKGAVHSVINAADGATKWLYGYD